MLNKTEGNNLLYEKILSGEPFMAARFGATEIKAILYPSLPKILKIFLKKRILRRMFTLSGFFPSTEENIIKFSSLSTNDINDLDILGSWRIEEFFYRNELCNVNIVKLESLEPYLNNNPWSQLLKNKKVLVVHPFAETIIEQYKNTVKPMHQQFVEPTKAYADIIIPSGYNKIAVDILVSSLETILNNRKKI